jgi:hypothetical protein
MLHRKLCDEAREVYVPSGAKVVEAPGPLLIRPGQTTDSRSKTALGGHLGKIRIEDNLTTTPSQAVEKAKLLRQVGSIKNHPAVWKAPGSMQRFEFLLSRMAHSKESSQWGGRVKVVNCRDHRRAPVGFIYRTLYTSVSRKSILK